MDRRQFSSLALGAAAFSLLPVSAPGEQSRDHSSSAVAHAAAIYDRALVLDCNSLPPYEDGKLPLPAADLDLVRRAGINVIKTSAGGINADFVETTKQIAYAQQMIEMHPDYFMQVRVPADLQRAKRENKLGIILSFESVEMLDGKIGRISLFRGLGVRVMQLSYNLKSPFGAGVMQPSAGGLTPLGRQAVKSMNDLGVTIDLSHANPQTTADTLAESSKTVIMSHAGCAAIHPHPRNKSDEQLRALAQKGGVIGIYDLPYLAASPKQPTVDDYMAHMEHALKVVGEEHVGIGSDVPINPFDTSAKGMEEFNKFEQQRQQSGLAAPEEDRPPYVVGMNEPRKLEVVADRLLKRGHSGRAVEKVLGANFVRVFRDTWTS